MEKIVHVIDSLSIGGAELLLKNSINLLPEYGHIVVYLNGPNDLQNEFVSKSVSFISLKHTGWKNLLRTITRLRRTIRREKPLLVHSHLFVSTICARLATPKKVPLVSTIHSTYSSDAFQKNKKSLLAERLTLKKRHALIAVSEFVLNDYLTYVPFKGKRFVVYNFLPHTFFTKDEKAFGNNSLRCIAVGNLKEAKNYGYLLDIWQEIKQENIFLDIYGTGGMEAELSSAIQRQGLKVRLCGRANDIKKLLLQYDLFVQASSHEGFGLSVIEAMASRVPVFISDIPVFSEITFNHAHFFPLADSKKAAELLQSLHNNTGKRNMHVADAYATCRRTFSADVFKQKLLSIYQSISK